MTIDGVVKGLSEAGFDDVSFAAMMQVWALQGQLRALEAQATITQAERDKANLAADVMIADLQRRASEMQRQIDAALKR